MPTPSDLAALPAVCALPLSCAEPATGSASVRHLEQRSLNAWAAPRSAVMGDWLLRAAQGYTKRANSANALQPGTQLTPALLDAIEAWYAHQGQRCIFRLSPLADAGVDALLQSHGYARVEPSLVMQRTAQAGDSTWQPPAGCTLHMDTQFSSHWLEGYSQANGLSALSVAAHRTILQTTALPCAYASIRCAGHVCAWGLAVLERGALGIYDVLVHPQQRRQGRGRVLVQSLLHWGAQHGASHCDLQVVGTNATAQQLYRSLGFAPVYGYHYRVQPAAPS